MLSMCAYGAAIDLKGYSPIGSMVKREVRSDGVVFSCSDGSKVSVSIVAEAIVRVRASFRADFPIDHSWVVVKRERPLPKISIETADSSTRILAGDVVVEVAHNPLLIAFRDRDGRVVNRDHLPLMYSESGSVMAVERLGFDERYYEHYA